MGGTLQYSLVAGRAGPEFSPLLVLLAFLPHLGNFPGYQYLEFFAFMPIKDSGIYKVVLAKIYN